VDAPAQKVKNGAVKPGETPGITPSSDKRTHLPVGKNEFGETAILDTQGRSLAQVRAAIAVPLSR
jgi:hypothetical protein